MLNTCQLLLTRKCNFACSYCNTYTSVTDEEVEVDRFLLSWVLERLSVQCIEYSGGEPGLVKDFPSILSIHPPSHQTIYSNGLVRMKYGCDIKENVDYFEHVTFNEKGNAVFPLDKHWFDRSGRYLVVVLTKDILDCPEIIAPFQDYKVWFKPLTPKVEQTDLSGAIKFLVACLRSANTNITTKSFALKELKRLASKDTINHCSSMTPHLYIDMENKYIGQCCVDTERCEKAELNEENLKLALDQRLFHHSPLCNDCVRSK